MQDLHAAVHALPVAAWGGHAVQEDGDLPDLCQDKECLPGAFGFRARGGALAAGASRARGREVGSTS